MTPTQWNCLQLATHWKVIVDLPATSSGNWPSSSCTMDPWVALTQSPLTTIFAWRTTTTSSSCLIMRLGECIATTNCLGGELSWMHWELLVWRCANDFHMYGNSSVQNHRQPNCWVTVNCPLKSMNRKVSTGGCASYFQIKSTKPNNICAALALGSVLTFVFLLMCYVIFQMSMQYLYSEFLHMTYMYI